jgi:hypothetical protein
MTPAEVLAATTRITPNFANTMHQAMSDPPGPTARLLALVTDPAENTPLRRWTDEPDFSNPLHLAP